MTSAASSTDALERARALAFRALFSTELQYVWDSLRYLGVRPDDLQDLAHEVFVTAFQRIDTLDPARPPRPWLFTIAAHAASNYRRLARHELEVLGEAHDLPDERANLEEHTASRQELTLVLRALHAIASERREVLILHDIDGFAMPEIAEALAIPLNTAYSRLRLARRDLKAAASHFHPTASEQL